jgi:hypothetical protein
MLRLRMISIPAALLFAASTASAQRWGGGSAVQTGHGSLPATRPTAPRSPAATASSNGTISKWGGSPPERSHDRQRGRIGLYGQPNAYIPIAVAAPDPVPAYVDSCPPPPEASVEMPVITTRHEDRQLTTIEVYRLQPRFQKP